MLRRQVVAFAPIFLLCQKAGAQIADPVSVSIRVTDDIFNSIGSQQRKFLSSVEVDRSEEAKELTSKIPDGRAAPVLLILVGLIATTQLVQLILEMLRQYYFGGVIIDMRSSTPKIYNDVKIPADMVIVISKNDQKMFQRKDVTQSFIENVFSKR